MQTSIKLPRKSTLVMSALLGGVIFTSCASVPQTSNQAMPKMQTDQAISVESTGNVAQQAKAEQ